MYSIVFNFMYRPEICLKFIIKSSYSKRHLLNYFLDKTYFSCLVTPPIRECILILC
jgi:hypothetical protein